MFVQARGSEGAALGIGKLVDRAGGLCTVEYFDAPTSEPVIHQFETNQIQAVPLPEQTRVYHYNEMPGAWEIGRILDDQGNSQLVQFPNRVTKHLKASGVFVRWARQIIDPTPFLANKINESPRFSDGRSALIRSQMNQRAASMGMSVLLTSAIELEAHQIEVVRRVLQDPVQRYLLADEVGLGKTIEAGILIRQRVLDAIEDFAILVLVPEPLIAQWRSELSSKFFLEHYLDKNIRVLALGDNDRIRPLLGKATMLVIDEAHHLTEARSTGSQSIYGEIAAATPGIERILLLSATPALHNERGFLEMLHLLDPKTYPLDGEAAFRGKIEARGRVLEIGVGSGLNLTLYEEQVEVVFGLDPSERLLSMAQRRAAEAGVAADLILGSATNIPLENASVDTVVMTWTLCSIFDPLSALSEMGRVLKPGGALLFVEHGLSPEPAIERWQHRLTPLWRHISGGCHLDRKVDDLIRAAGFEILELRNEYARGPRLMTYMYEGQARPAVSVWRGDERVP